MKNKIAKTILLLTAVEGILASLWLLLLPSDEGMQRLISLSPSRLVMMLPMVLLAVLALVGLFLQRKKTLVLDEAMLAGGLWGKSLAFLRWLSAGVHGILLLGVLLAPIFLNAENEVYLFSSENPFLPRLLPLLTFLVLMGIQINAGIYFSEKVTRETDTETRPRLSGWMFGAALVVVLGVFVANQTWGWGVNVYDGWIADWGMPLLEWQVGFLLVTFLHGFLLLVTQGIVKKTDVWMPRRDVWIALVIWAVTFLIWNFTPFDFDGSYFNTNPTPPTFELFPHSDARQYYSASVEFITGDGIDNSFARQYYVLFLALGNVVFDYSIAKIILAQIVILAMIPAMLYLLTARLGQRFVGVFLAMIVMVRETNAIRNAGALNTTPVHLIMSDMVCLLLIVMTLYFAIRWLQAKENTNRRHFALITGALLGINIALRIYVILFVPVLVLLLFLFQQDRKRWWREMVAYGVGLAIAILPVLLRNYLATGVITLERPIFWDHFMNFSSMSNTTSASEVAPTFGGIVVNLLANVGPLLTKTGNHFSNDLLSSWMTFFATSHAQAEGTYFYYLVPDMLTRWSNFVGWRVAGGFVIAVLCVVGLVRSFRTQRQATWLLLSFYLTYALGMAWVGASGWRFILPVDWIVFFFVLVGVQFGMQWLFAVPAGFAFDEGKVEVFEEKTIKTRRTMWVAGLFLLIASVYLIRDMFLPTPYLLRSSEENCALIETVDDDFCANQLDAGVEFEQGRLLYPSFYAGGAYFDQAKENDLFLFQDFDRYTFTLIGQGPKHVFLPSKNPALALENGMPVIVGLIETEWGWQAVSVFDVKDEIFYSSIPFEE